MERCQLHVLIPSSTKRLKADVMLDGPGSVDIWELDSNVSLNGVKPSRVRLAGHFALNSLNTEIPWTSEDFSCPSRTSPTFEFSLRNTGAGLIDWWQDREKPNGVYLSPFHRM